MLALEHNSAIYVTFFIHSALQLGLLICSLSADHHNYKHKKVGAIIYVCVSETKIIDNFTIYLC